MWPGIRVGVKPSPCPSLAPSVGQQGWLCSTLVFIYLPVKFLRRAPALQKYSKNASDHSSASAGPQVSGDCAGQPCPRTPRSLQVAVPRVQGHCAMARLGSPCPTRVGVWDSHHVRGTFIIFPCLGSSWFGSFSALTEGLVLLQCASVRRSWEGDCIQWAQPWASVCLLNFLG